MSAERSDEFMTSACPTPAELEAYSSARLDEASAEVIAEHVQHCERCENVLQDIERRGQGILRQLAGDPPTQPFPREPQCTTAVQHARQVTPEAAESQPASEPLTEPRQTRIRDYELLRLVGRGGMGFVYQAMHTKLNRIVAVKLLNPERTRSANGIARFRREVMTMGRFDHPNLVHASDAGEFDGQPFLVMDYVDGCNLSRLVKLLGPLTVSNACELIRQAALGLQHVHEQGLVHRDIAPSNVILSRDGIVKVTDLGLALLDERRFGNLPSLTASGEIMGTLDYMAPEQAVNTDVDIRADIYGLGATLFKLLTGASPLAALNLDTPLKKAAALTTFQAPNIADQRADLPPELITVVNRLLHRDPTERPAKPIEVARALEPFTTDSDLVALCESALSAEPPETSEHELEHPPWWHRSSPTEVSRRPYSPLALVIIVAWLAAGAGWWAASRQQAERVTDAGKTVAIEDTEVISQHSDIPVEREIAKEVLKIGGTIDIAYDEDSFGIENVDELPAKPFGLQYIMLAGNPRVDDALLKRIATLPALVGLTLQHTRITDEGVYPLGQIPTLSDIYFYGAPLTDDGVQPITQLSNLRELVLSDTNITDITLQRLANQPQLKRLFVKGTSITSASLPHIGQLTTLEELDLRRTAITDESLVHLQKLTSLRELWVANTAISDAGLEHLKVLKNLQVLDVIETAVTPTGASRLHAALPNCEGELHE